EFLRIGRTVNAMVDQLSSFADEVSRVAREVGTDGKLGGQAKVKGVSGTWKDLTENVNLMASNLTDQVRNIALVTTAVAGGDLTQKITVDAKGEVAALAETINVMVDQLSSFAAEVTRVAREVGTDGKLGGQARVEGVSGTWKDLTDSVNQLAGNLTAQVRNIAQVTTAVARGDLSQKITVDVKGEILELKDTINVMVDQLRSFAAEVTRVAKEVGTEGELGGQAEVEGVSGTWRDLTENVNQLASNLTGQVRNIAQVTTAVARGDLSQKITVDAKGEVAALADTINTMVDQLRSFAAEVTRVAREVGTEGLLGGQAEVEGVSGTWRGLTENVNQLAGNLTTQVRAIAEVSTAVTRGDLTRSITVEARGEVAELKDNINQMIGNLRETTQKNAEQDWLKTNLARISSMLQGQRDLGAVSQLIMSEITPLVQAHHGAFFLAEPAEDEAPVLRLIAGYGYTASGDVPQTFHFGEGLVGQTAIEKQNIVLSDAPNNYIRIASGLGEAPPTTIIVMPILFEEQVLGVIEIATFQRLAPIHVTFLDQVMETIGIVLNTIIATMRTEELLAQSQRLAQELQEQQEELKRSNAELEAQAKTLTESELLLQRQQEELQQTNREIEAARRNLEEKAEQLALSSKYKSEFLANMSHELRTPLNSVLILAKLLSDNSEGNLTTRQIDYARTIHAGGSDLLALISDILDLSKVEAGRMDVHATAVSLHDLRDYVESTFRPVAAEKNLDFEIDMGPTVPPTLVTDEQRLQQVLKNLLSNAFKFTRTGSVILSMYRPHPGLRFLTPSLNQVEEVVAFSVTDTGIGVPEDKLRLIFEAFQQADGTTSRKYGGTGLGLNISREIARLLGGEIHVESRLGDGSTFTLFLPLEYREVDGSVPRGPEGEILTTARRPRIADGASGIETVRTAGEPALLTLVPDEEALPVGTPIVLAMPDDIQRFPLEGEAFDPVPEGTKILVVDDDVRNVFALTSALESQGMEVVFAENGREGIAQLQAHPDVSLVLMDVMMPEMDGYETTRAIRQLPDFEKLPIISLTAKAMKGDREKSLASGASDYITKPVDVVQLLSLMRLWLSR
ncbi:MAG: HAMP domain-containing protein, partial [Candidatus Dormibacteria bacterium]